MNTWYKAAVVCWIVGSLLAIVGISVLFFRPNWGFGIAVALFVGLVCLATGGTLHQIAKSRR